GEVGGREDGMRAKEEHLHEVAIERERRRSRHGYATPAEARAFLQMARQPQHTPNARIATNPISAAYFRAAEEEASEPRHHATDVAARGDDIPTSIDTVIELLTEAGRLRQGYGGQGVVLERPVALLEAADEDPRAARLPVLRRLMEYVLHHDETAYLTRSRELAFLANMLLAGSSVQSRQFTSREASDAAACICNLGLECLPA